MRSMKDINYRRATFAPEAILRSDSPVKVICYARIAHIMNIKTKKTANYCLNNKQLLIPFYVLVQLAHALTVQDTLIKMSLCNHSTPIVFHCKPSLLPKMQITLKRL